MSYFDNLRVIAHGGGSDQARACRDKKCPQCDDDDWVEGGGEMTDKVTLYRLKEEMPEVTVCPTSTFFLMA